VSTDSAAPDDDLLLLADGCVLPTGGLARLTAAAHGRLETATASAIALPGAVGGRAAAPIHSRLAAPGGPAILVRRDAIELAGEPVRAADGTVDPAFVRRCTEAGLTHVLADDVVVAADDPWPGHDDAERREPLTRAVRAARRRTRAGLALALDARPLTGVSDGTRVHVLELLAALGRAAAAAGEPAVTALVDAGDEARVRELLAGLPGAAVASVAAPPPAAARPGLVHRPFQVDTPADLGVLAAWGERLVVTQQDLIGYHRADYFSAPGAWENYRALTRRALAVADHVVFPSAHARDDALAEGVVDPERSAAVHHGVDHAVVHRAADAVVPAGAPELAGDDRPFILCLGTDYRHKNRPFALRVLAELQDRHDWPGRLVLAGPPVRWGSSAEAETRLLDASPRLAAAVVRLGPVSEAEKRWLWERAALAAYPTVTEGFGFLPFEAADHGVPCLWADGTAMSEVLGGVAAPIRAWDAAATAQRALALMRGGDERDALLDGVRAAAATLRWDATAVALRALYAQVCARPPSPASASERAEGIMRAGFSEDATRLLGPGGLVPRDVERPLLALAARPRIAASVYAALRLGYRLSRRAR
jgi:glycosyltransferase involved in cell wall biosynthesis